MSTSDEDRILRGSIRRLEDDRKRLEERADDAERRTTQAVGELCLLARKVKALEKVSHAPKKIPRWVDITCVAIGCAFAAVGSFHILQQWLQP